MQRMIAAVSFLFVLSTGGGLCDDLLLLPVPSFLKPTQFQEIPGAKRTVLAPSKTGSGFYEPISGSDAFSVLVQRTSARGDEILSSLEPEVMRNGRVIEGLVYRSEGPDLPAILFGKSLLTKHKNVLGDELLIAIPNQFTVFLFPKLATEHSAYARQIRALYKDSPYPVSLELFLLTKKAGLTAVGVFDQSNQ